MTRARDRDDRGFSLIELMVVVLIIAILIAIAVPTFLGARQRSQNRAAQSNLRNAFAAEKTIYTDNQTYTSSIAAMTAIEPSITYATSATPSATANNVTLDTAGNDTVLYLMSKSASGTCFYLKDDTVSGTTYAKDTSCGADTSQTYGTSW